MPFTAQSSGRAVDYVVTAANWNEAMADLNYFFGTTGTVGISSGLTVSGPITVNSANVSITGAGGYSLQLDNTKANSVKTAFVAGDADWNPLDLVFYDVDEDAIRMTINMHTGTVDMTSALNVAASLVASSSVSITGSLICSSSASIAGNLFVSGTAIYGPNGVFDTLCSSSEVSFLGLGTTRPEIAGVLWQSSTMVAGANIVAISTGASP